MAQSRSNALVGVAVDLSVTFRHPVTGALWDPFSVDAVEFLATDGVTVLLEILPPGITALGVGQYQVTVPGVLLTAEGTYFDRWTYVEEEGEAQDQATLSTFVADTGFGTAITVDILAYLREQAQDTDLANPIFQYLTYVRAVEFALQKLSDDIDESYLAEEDVPFKHRYLLKKLATIWLAHLRAGVDMGASRAIESAGGIKEIQVPDLHVWSAEASQLDLGNFWLAFARDLQKEYDGELGRMLATGEADDRVVLQGTVTRTSLRTGKVSVYAMDTGVDAPVSTVRNGGGGIADVRWEVVRDPQFAGYEVYRATSSSALEYPAEAQRVVFVPDVNWYVSGGRAYPRYLDGPGAGIWYYRMATVNSNGVRNYAPVASVVVT